MVRLPRCRCVGISPARIYPAHTGASALQLTSRDCRVHGPLMLVAEDTTAPEPTRQAQRMRRHSHRRGAAAPTAASSLAAFGSQGTAACPCRQHDTLPRHRRRLAPRGHPREVARWRGKPAGNGKNISAAPDPHDDIAPWTPTVSPSDLRRTRCGVKRPQPVSSARAVFDQSPA